MRALLLTALVIALGLPVQAQKGGLRAFGYSAAALDSLPPPSPDPFSAYLNAGVEGDVPYWTARTALAGALRGQTRALRGLRQATTGEYRERERGALNRNDGLDQAERIEGFSRAEDEPTVTVTGALGAAPGAPTRTAVADEGTTADGAFSPWRVRMTTNEGETVTAIVDQSIGDGAYGATSGDVDAYQIVLTTPVDYLTLAVRTPVGSLDPVLALYDGEGHWIDTKDDTEGFDPVMGVGPLAAGTYTAYVWGFTGGASAPGLRVEFDPASGFGAGSTGPYELHITTEQPDVDAFEVELRAGDVLQALTASASVDDVSIFGPDGTLRMRSRMDYSGFYPTGGPLLSPSQLGTGEGITAALVAPEDGAYRVVLRGRGDYQMVVQAVRAGHERAGRQKEVIYLDFEGGTFSPRTDIREGFATATLSPMRSFLPRWGLTPADESAVIDAFLTTFRRLVRDAVRADVPGMSGLDVIVLNSRDHADPGRDAANRIVVAGSVAELGAEGFIGKSSTIDIGNFGHDDIAYVILDLRSARPGEDGYDGDSLNRFAVADGRTKAELVGHGLAVVSAHEAGHFLGLHHTDAGNDVRNVIDQGGASPLWHVLDVGADLVFGAGDGGDVRFREDDLTPNHPFEGLEAAPDAIAYGVAEAALSGPAYVSDVTGLLRNAGFGAGAQSAALGRRGRLLLRDAFADDRNGWASTYASGSRAGVSSGALDVTAAPGTALAVFARDVRGSGAFAARTSMRAVEGCSAKGGGLAFWASGSYRWVAMAGLSGDREVRLLRYDGGVWTLMGSGFAPWARSEDWTDLEVVAAAGKVRVFVDGQPVVQVAAEAPKRTSFFGLTTDSCGGVATTHRFDAVTVVDLGVGEVVGGRTLQSGDPARGGETPAAPGLAPAASGVPVRADG